MSPPYLWERNMPGNSQKLSPFLRGKKIQPPLDILMELWAQANRMISSMEAWEKVYHAALRGMSRQNHFGCMVEMID